MHTANPGCRHFVPAASFVVPAGPTRDFELDARLACSERDFIRELDPRSPRPRLGFPRYVRSMRASVDQCRLSTSAMRHDVRARSERPNPHPSRKPVAPLTGPVGFSDVYALTVFAPFGVERAKPQRATKILQKSVELLCRQQAGRVISAGRQTPSEGPAQCGGDPPRNLPSTPYRRQLAATEVWRVFRRAIVLTVTSSKTLLGGRGSARSKASWPRLSFRRPPAKVNAFRKAGVLSTVSCPRVR